MSYSFYEKFSSSGYDDLGLLNQSLHNFEAFDDVPKNGLLSSSRLLVGKDEIFEDKGLAALKNHSEAERRRRQRINGHLTTLRGLVASTHQKMDKATLLGKVISQVKELKKNSMEASKGYIIPMEVDELKVEPYDIELGYGCMTYMATICCDYQPEILSDLRKAIDALQIEMVKSEMSTLEKRMKNVFIFTCCKEESANVEACKSIANVVHRALGSVLEKASDSMEFLLSTSYPNKRRRMCLVETSTPSCNDGSCSS